VVERDAEVLEHTRGEAFVLAQEAEHDVLGPDVVVRHRPRLLLRENDHLPGLLGEALEHAASDPTPDGRRTRTLAPWRRCHAYAAQCAA